VESTTCEQLVPELEELPLDDDELDDDAELDVLLDAVTGLPPIPPEEVVSVPLAAPAPPCPEGTPPVVKHPAVTTAVSADKVRPHEGPFTRGS
jgi:hypothetical protein